MHRRFQKILHEYKRDVFQIQHHRKDAEGIAKECMDIREDVLQQKYSYHFHTLPDADRAEIINMINNYTREAILPPVVEKLAEKYVMLDRRVDALQTMLEQMLEALSVPLDQTTESAG